MATETTGGPAEAPLEHSHHLRMMEERLDKHVLADLSSTLGIDGIEHNIGLVLDLSRRPPLPGLKQHSFHVHAVQHSMACLLYTSDAADEEDSVDLGGRRIIKKKKKKKIEKRSNKI
eukprot:TRINITY_DN7719_c0_g1_i16.p1 TRINITY_DN7719_c0_g1~~TRINITY_DN7719_c0_g1_i16.p1  ORF type:complete len:117 (-),score=32.78 TRINITY_DN7719_c0_g1_i16:43-393(-)